MNAIWRRAVDDARTAIGGSAGSKTGIHKERNLVLELERVTVVAGGQTHLYGVDLSLTPGAINVLLGPTQAGKTTLMRVMAGLDKPTSGRVLVDGRDVTGVGVRQRNLAMVYQQFINYPAMTVFENIASPLRLQGIAAKEVNARVNEVAGKLHIEHLLTRRPGELSGGQQQRCALARALVKRSSLVLLDEPLVNLDYKLREELRDELGQLFATGLSTVVYATTEPTEALLLGGHTAVLHAGELLQYGPTAEVFHKPKSIRVARAFSDPPMNLVEGTATGRGVALPGGVEIALALPAGVSATSGGRVTLGVRAGALRVQERPGDIALPGRVELAEISGSDTFVHASTPIGEVVAQLTGVHVFRLGTSITLYLDPRQAYVFDALGDRVIGPEHGA
jgi:glycerol transport system ATP-binding protein